MGERTGIRIGGAGRAGGFLLGLVVALVAGCSGGESSGEAHEDFGGRAITIRTLPALRFEPPEIRIAVGERVTVMLENRDETTLHDFVVDAMPVDHVHAKGEEHTAHGHDAPVLHVAAAAGTIAMLSFTPTAPGEYAFACSAEGHADAGMRGVVVVTE